MQSAPQHCRCADRRAAHDPGLHPATALPAGPRAEAIAAIRVPAGSSSSASIDAGGPTPRQSAARSAPRAQLCRPLSARPWHHGQLSGSACRPRPSLPAPIALSAARMSARPAPPHSSPASRATPNRQHGPARRSFPRRRHRHASRSRVKSLIEAGPCPARRRLLGSRPSRCGRGPRYADRAGTGPARLSRRQSRSRSCTRTPT